MSITCDVRYGLRLIARRPAFAVVAILTLALGIGANSAMFSVVHAVLLAPFPYAEPDRIVVIWSKWVGFDKTWLSELELLDYEREVTSLDAVGAWSEGSVNLTGGTGDPERVVSARVSADLFSVLGEAQRSSLAEDLTVRHFGKGERVIEEGAAGHTFYLVATGSVAVMAGKPAREVTRLSVGQYFGEMSLLTGEPRSATVVAAEDSLLLEVDRPTFAEWLRSRRKQYPNSHTRWSSEEREQLAHELGGGSSWQRIADVHGRTVHAVQREAVKDGLVAAEAFPRPGVE